MSEGRDVGLQSSQANGGFRLNKLNFVHTSVCHKSRRHDEESVDYDQSVDQCQEFEMHRAQLPVRVAAAGGRRGCLFSQQVDSWVDFHSNSLLRKLM